MRSFLGAPILHRGERLGNLYLTGKESGRAFTSEDEETLVMFASHAAMAIANARRHMQERRARADLETLIDTSPVGVVVFDARTGVSVSFNREARRILGDLVSPGGDVEQLLESVTFRRADGREISLDEFPLAQVLSTSETVRAEEIVIQVPDGRSVTTLVNATPIRSEEGGVESVVVTLQDMTPLEELERQRAEFLGMVSHELRTPLTSIRGSASTLLDSSSDLRPAEMRQFLRIILEQADHMRELIGDLLDMAHIETGTLPVTPEPAEIASLVDQARNTFLSAGGRDHLDIDLPADLPLVMADRRRVVQVPLQPAVQRLPVLAGVFSHPGGRGAGRGPRGGLRRQRGTGHLRRAIAAPLRQVHAHRERGRQAGPGRVRPGPGHLQGDRGGPRGPDLGRERRRRAGGALHLHPSRGRGGRHRPSSLRQARRGRRRAPHPGGGTTTRRPSATSVTPSRRRSTTRS